jgi:tRNA (mo5U34)-methyltransferase
MEEKYQQLREKLTARKNKVTEIEERFEKEAIALLETGNPFSENLLQELAEYTKIFTKLRGEVLELAKKSAIYPMASPVEITSLTDIESLLEKIALTPEKLKEKIGQIDWYHSIDLGNGIITPGYAKNISPYSEEIIGLPEDLTGMTVLDIGAWDGFYSFAAEKRGASRVLATDWFVWKELRKNGKAGFELARRVLNSQVEDLEIDVLDLSPEKVGIFDLVLFLGVLYHLRHPLLALEKVARVTGKQLILETHVDLLELERPAMAFYPGRELNDDPTNWCGPNPAMVKGMLETVGFKKVKIAFGPLKHDMSTRMVFHAWR